MAVRPVAVAFDIIGTVFSLDRLGDGLEEIGLTPLALDFVYNTPLRDSFALAVTGGFAPFDKLLAAALDEICAAQGLSRSTAQKEAALAAMSNLLPYEDAENAFKTLLEVEIRIIALSNGAVASTTDLLERAGLADYVEIVLSSAELNMSKPRREV